MNDAATTASSTTVKVTPPAEGGPFDKFVLTACPSAGLATACKAADCAPARIAACPLTGLTPNTNYDVSAVAVAGTQASQPSNKDTFRTLANG